MYEKKRYLTGQEKIFLVKKNHAHNSTGLCA